MNSTPAAGHSRLKATPARPEVTSMGAPQTESLQRLRMLVVLAAFGALLATGCSTIRGERTDVGFGGDSPSELAFEESSTEVAPAPTTPAVASADPNAVHVSAENRTAGPFAFTADALLSDDVIDGVDLYEDRPTIVTFVTPTCPICAVEGPFIAEAAAANPDVTIAIVHSQGTPTDHLAYVDRHELDLANIVHIDDPDMALWTRFNVISQPSSVLVASDGATTFSTGALGTNGFERAVALLR